jgi:hypothetical protein
MRCLEALRASPESLNTCARTMCAQATETAAAPSPEAEAAERSFEGSWVGIDCIRLMASLRQSLALDTWGAVLSRKNAGLVHKFDELPWKIGC